MKNYYLSTYVKNNGNYEVHSLDCYFLPKQEHRILLGFFDDGKDALNAAKKYKSNIEGCKFCIPECYKLSCPPNIEQMNKV